MVSHGALSASSEQFLVGDIDRWWTVVHGEGSIGVMLYNRQLRESLRWLAVPETVTVNLVVNSTLVTLSSLLYS